MHCTSMVHWASIIHRPPVRISNIALAAAPLVIGPIPIMPRHHLNDGCVVRTGGGGRNVFREGMSEQEKSAHKNWLAYFNEPHAACIA